MDTRCCVGLVLVFWIKTIAGSNPCCSGVENVLANRQCSDGSNVTLISCTNKYLVTNGQRKENVRVIQNDSLLFENTIILKDRYCYSRINHSQQVYLVCFDEVAKGEDIIFAVDAVLEIVSVFFIIFTILIYLQVPDLLDLQGICIIHSISGLAVSFIVLATNQLSTAEIQNDLCVGIAFLIYFSMLYAFFWLNLLAFHIWRTIVKPKIFKTTKNWIRIYHAFGLGGPTILLILLLVVHYSEFLQLSEMHPGFGENKCWFKTIKSQFLYFYAPMACLLLLNIIYYAWTVSVLWTEISKSDEKKAKVLKFKLTLSAKLFFIMGMTWVFEILSAALKNTNEFLKVFWIITDCLNTLQGIFIFLILVVFRKKVVRGLAERTILGKRLPNRWRALTDEECEELDEEIGLSETNVYKI